MPLHENILEFIKWALTAPENKLAALTHAKDHIRVSFEHGGFQHYFKIADVGVNVCLHRITLVNGISNETPMYSYPFESWRNIVLHSRRIAEECDVMFLDLTRA